MRKPKSPPRESELLTELTRDNRLAEVLAKPIPPLVDGKYIHWDKLRYYQPPYDLSHREWWFALKNARGRIAEELPLEDRFGSPFTYSLVDPIPQRLHQIDLGAGGIIQTPDQVINSETKADYYVSSLMEEAITSSQLEGAVTTRVVAKEMIRAGRRPKDRSERMILNNYNTMKRIGKLRTEPLCKELIFEIHRLITDNTLDDTKAAGRLRQNDDVVVGDMYGEVYHRPPPASQLEDRMAEMCDFANGKTPEQFVHPAIRSIALHFWLSYDHPFVDGNGRTARALFYWLMLRHKYWLCEYISISRIILKGPSKYERAFLYSEIDGNDLTYFILYHLNVFDRAIRELHNFIKHKTEQLREVECELQGMIVLNHRQRALISHALRHPKHIYTIESHRSSHNIVYQTGRNDLLNLVERGLLEKKKVGKGWLFTPSPHLTDKLSELH